MPRELRNAEYGHEFTAEDYLLGYPAIITKNIMKRMIPILVLHISQEPAVSIFIYVTDVRFLPIGYFLMLLIILRR